eukprot:sb/3475649/
MATNQNSLFRSRDWLSANQGPVFPDTVEQCPKHISGGVRAPETSGTLNEVPIVSNKEKWLVGWLRAKIADTVEQYGSQSELVIKSRDWLSANQGPVFPDTVERYGSNTTQLRTIRIREYWSLIG